MWFYDLLFLIWYSTWQFYNYFYIDTEFKTPYPLPFPESLSPADNSLSDTIFSLISTVTQGKCRMKINEYL